MSKDKFASGPPALCENSVDTPDQGQWKVNQGNAIPNVPKSMAVLPGSHRTPEKNKDDR
jgi:hypothetical protein